MHLAINLNTVIPSVKRIAGFLLLTCLVLPMSQCSTVLSEESKQALRDSSVGTDAPLTSPLTSPSNPESKPSAASSLESDFKTYFVWTGFKWHSWESWVYLLAFLWPLFLFVMASSSRSRGRGERWARYLEAPFLILTVLALYGLQVMKQPLLGWYVGVTAVCLYLLALLVQWQHWWRERHSQA